MVSVARGLDWLPTVYSGPIAMPSHPRYCLKAPIPCAGQQPFYAYNSTSREWDRDTDASLLERWRNGDRRGKSARARIDGARVQNLPPVPVYQVTERNGSRCFYTIQLMQSREEIY